MASSLPPISSTAAKSCTSLKLIGPTMFRTFRCVWMLEELQVPYEHETVRSKPWSKLSKRHHPQGKIPILIDSGSDNKDFVLYESAAINTYLGDKYGSSLVPSLVSLSSFNSTNNNDNTSSTRIHTRTQQQPQLQQRACYNQLTYLIMTEMDAQGLWIHRKHEGPLAQYFGECPQAVQEAKRQFDKAQQVLEAQLSASSAKAEAPSGKDNSGGPYLLGRNFTAVDILHVHCLDWAKSIGWFQPPTVEEEGRAALRTYLDLCRARPAYQKTVAKRRTEQEAEKARQLSKL